MKHSVRILALLLALLLLPVWGLAETQYPIVEEPLTLTYWRRLDSRVATSLKNQGEMFCYQIMEALTGIHVEFIHPPMGQEQEQLNLMIAGGDLPDIIDHYWRQYPGGPSSLIEENIIVPLNDYLQYAPNLEGIYAETPEAKKQAVLDDGTHYYFPFFRIDAEAKAGGPIIRKDWLEKLGLELPVTVDDWYEMLVAFRDGDPNGNGEADEIPFVSKDNQGTGLESIYSLTAPFGVIHGFYQKEAGVVGYGPIEEGYRQFLTTLSKWYAEGLIDPDFAATDGNSYDAKITGDRSGAYIGRVNNTLGRYITLKAEQGDNSFDLTGATWPIGPANKPYNIRGDMVSLAFDDGAVITTANKHIVESVKWMDYAYGEEGALLFNFGIEGETYNMVDGEPVFSDFFPNSPLGFNTAHAMYCPSAFSAPMLALGSSFKQSLAQPQQQQAVDIWASNGDVSLLLPPMTGNAEQNARLSDIMSDVSTYALEMAVKFIMGTESLENYDNFVSNLERMGIQEAIAIQQEILDGFNAR